MLRIEVVPNGHAHEEDKPGDQPIIFRRKRERIVVRPHEKYDWKSKIVMLKLYKVRYIVRKLKGYNIFKVVFNQ